MISCFTSVLLPRLPDRHHADCPCCSLTGTGCDTHLAIEFATVSYDLNWIKKSKTSTEILNYSLFVEPDIFRYVGDTRLPNLRDRFGTFCINKLIVFYLLSRGLRNKNVHIH